MVLVKTDAICCCESNLGDLATWASAGVALVALLAAIASVQFTKQQWRYTNRPRLKAFQFVFDIREGNDEGHFLIANEGGEKCDIIQSKYIALVTAEPLTQIHPTRRANRIEVGYGRNHDNPETRLSITAGNVVEEPIKIGAPLTSEDAEAIFSGKRTLYLIGWICYRGSLGINYWTQFAREYDHEKNRFVVISHDDWEYRS